ncbi:peptidoglycan-binding protein [Desertivirga brevis]|uniref:peptidoglycan-binding protein n=1 Tax=Desertivirga brevis TaxID=2810310 RepID=UPI001F625EFF|nr:peptidoglycan-binding protein [Pedobacter sp. SYSU D00873]
MIKILTYILPLLLLSQVSRITNFNKEQKAVRGRKDLRAIYTAEIGVKEKSGKNDGVRVEEYLAYAGLKRGSPWCASFVCWALGKAGIPNPRSGYSPSLFPKSKQIWIRGSPFPKKLLIGDVFGLYFPEKGRIAHVGFVDRIQSNMLISVEGNTNEAGSREGDGVFRKRRLLSSIYCISRWQ